MTAMELKCLKMDLVEELLSIDDKDTLNRVKNYLKKLNNKIRTKAEEEETEYISKEEILAGIDAGLKDMIAGRKQSARDFLASFKKEAKRLRKHYASFIDDYEKLLGELEQNPRLGTDLGNGLRKIRMRISSKGRGKSGGARVISFTVVVAIDETEINLLYIYDKAERESISLKEIEELLRKNGLK